MSVLPINSVQMGINSFLDFQNKAIQCYYSCLIQRQLYVHYLLFTHISQYIMSSTLHNPYHFFKSQKSGLAKSKEIALTNNQSDQPSTQQQGEELTQDHPKTSTILLLQLKINKIKRAQQTLENKFQKVLENLSLQISQKDEINLNLQKQIEALHLFLTQSKQDMQIIKAYLKKQQSKENIETNGKKQLPLNQTVLKTYKVQTKNPIFTDITVQSIARSRKSTSPRTKLLKRNLKC